MSLIHQQKLRSALGPGRGLRRGSPARYPQVKDFKQSITGREKRFGLERVSWREATGTGR